MSWALHWELPWLWDFGTSSPTARMAGVWTSTSCLDPTERVQALHLTGDQWGHILSQCGPCLLQLVLLTLPLTQLLHTQASQTSLQSWYRGQAMLFNDGLFTNHLNTKISLNFTFTKFYEDFCIINTFLWITDFWNNQFSNRKLCTTLTLHWCGLSLWCSFFLL